MCAERVELGAVGGDLLVQRAVPGEQCCGSGRVAAAVRRAHQGTLLLHPGFRLVGVAVELGRERDMSDCQVSRCRDILHMRWCSFIHTNYRYLSSTSEGEQ